MSENKTHNLIDNDIVGLDEDIRVDDIFDGDSSGEASDEELSGDTIVFDKKEVSSDTKVIETSGGEEYDVSEEEMTAYLNAIKKNGAEDADSGDEHPEDNEEVPDEEPEDADDDKNYVPKHSKRSRFAFAQLIFYVIGGILAIIIVLSPLFEIKVIEVEGNKFYTKKQVINMAEARTGGNIFIGAEKGKIKENLMKDPYFMKVSVGRKLPNTLVIKVKEREQLAALKYGDRSIVIGSDLRVLRIAEIDPEVTIVEGMTIKKFDINEPVEVEETNILSDMISTLDTMKEGDLYFKHIIISKSGIEAYIYDTLKVKGTSAQLKRAIEKGILQKVVNKLFKQKIDHGTINLGDDDYISFSPSL